MDSTCFSSTIVGVDGFGHLCNSSHKNSFRREHREPNCDYVEIGRGMFIVSTLRDIQTGEELLCDYHWNVSSLPDEHKKSGFPRGLLQYCGCGECKLKLRQSKQVLKEKGAESCVGILQQTSELQTQFLRHYFSDSMYVQSADVIDDAVSQYSIQEIFESIDRELPDMRNAN